MKSLAIALGLGLGLVTTAGADKVFMQGKGASWDCAKDPVIEINHGNAAYTFKGDCKEININGGKNKLEVESVESLNINGSDNTLTIGVAGDVVINGSKNTVTWKKAKTGAKPEITINGTKNSITKAK